MVVSDVSEDQDEIEDILQEMNESQSQISLASEQSSQMSDFDISDQDEEEFLGLDFDKQAETSS